MLSEEVALKNKHDIYIYIYIYIAHIITLTFACIYIIYYIHIYSKYTYNNIYIIIHMIVLFQGFMVENFGFHA